MGANVHLRGRQIPWQELPHVVPDAEMSRHLPPAGTQQPRVSLQSESEGRGDLWPPLS